MGQYNITLITMKVPTLLLTVQTICVSTAPQGLLNGLSNLLSSVVGGGGPAGEVENYENAPYTVVQKLNNFEERFYPSSKWVCTRTGGFMSLFRYISGSNSRNQKIDMTVPVMSTVSEKGKEMCFYLTEAFQSNPPPPTATNVYLVQKKAMTVYATTMGGYPDMAGEARKFRDQLERGLASQVDFSSYMSLSYDNPWKVMNRRNDILYKKTPPPKKKKKKKKKE